MATSHYGQGSWLWNCEGLLKFIRKYSHGKSKLNYARSWAFKCSVKRQTRWDCQSKTISLPYYSCNWPFYIKHYKKSIVVRLWYVIVSWFGVRPCSSRWVGRIHSMSCRTPCRYILSIQASTTLWASSSSVKWSGTVPIFSNNERTQISMVPGHFYSSVKSAALSWKRALRNLQWGEFI